MSFRQVTPPCSHVTLNLVVSRVVCISLPPANNTDRSSIARWVQAEIEMEGMALPRFGSARAFPPKTREEEDDDERCYQRHRDFAATLPEAELKPFHFRQLQGFWFHDQFVPGILAAGERFAARPTDVILASTPKCGTTWLKSLLLSVVDRKGDRHPGSPRHPLLAANPHDYVPFIEELYTWYKNPHLDHLQTPRLLASHLPLSLLPASVKSSGCRLVYICRDPKDAFVSRWHFWKGIQGRLAAAVAELDLDAAFDLFCAGVIPFGSMWEHVLEYWEEHRRRPDEVMFLKYEDVKKEPAEVVRRLAAFLGRPFSSEEEREGVVEAVVSLCSLENMRRVNRDGDMEGDRGVPLEKKLYFRKGEVGDWPNLLTPEMAERLDAITQQKLRGSELIL